MRNSLLWLVVAGVVAFAPSVRAANFDISPVAVDLSGQAPSATVVITNRATEAVRLQVALYAWEQTEKGEPVLKPTQDVLFFPAMLALNPREARNIRIGTKIKPGTTERSYRLYIQELPNPTRGVGTGPTAVKMLTRLGIPVFLAPPVARARPTLSPLAIKGSKVVFRTSNPGNAHTRANRIILTAKNGDKVVHSQELDTWYLLAGGSRLYEVELPRDVCLATSYVEVAFDSDAGDARQSLVGRCLP